MEAKDLRIGNLVMYSDNSTIFTVSGLHEFGMDCFDDVEETYIEYDQFEGISLTEEWVLKFEQFDKTDKEGTPCFFNGDNIMLFDRGGCFDAYLHSEVDGSVFFATRLFYVHQLQNFYHAIEKQELTIKE